jgi:hypothetical protein
VINSDDLENHISKNIDAFKVNELMLTLWSLDQLSLGTSEFWQKVYSLRLQKILSSKQEVYNDNFIKAKFQLMCPIDINSFESL